MIAMININQKAVFIREQVGENGGEQGPGETVAPGPLSVLSFLT